MIGQAVGAQRSKEACLSYTRIEVPGQTGSTGDSLEKTVMLGKIEGRKRRGRQRMRWLDSIISSMALNLNKLWDIVEDREAWHAAVHRVTKSWTQLRDWTKQHLLFTFSIWRQEIKSIEFSFSLKKIEMHLWTLWTPQPITRTLLVRPSCLSEPMFWHR